MINHMKVSTAQFEPRCGDKEYNLNLLEKLITNASEKEADVISYSGWPFPTQSKTTTQE